MRCVVKLKIEIDKKYDSHYAKLIYRSNGA